MSTREPRRSLSARYWRPLRNAELAVQSRALALLGITPEDRYQVVAIMLERRRDAVGYWLQLLISTGIATLGLALGSTAVVIGAMLIAPLMGPIVELGMALVIGSPALTLRSLIRTVGSVVVVICCAALLTLLLPFHEINPEIASRTFPTALDLLIAVFVALIAVFTTVRSTSETTSAAAGTAIGIALVPPVCVIGFGIGIGDASVAGGATLLFVANLVAILFISVLSFWVLGFEHVNASAFEEATQQAARPGSLTRRAIEGLERLFGSRYGRVVRVGIPALLIAVTYVPLATALDQVAWEVKARGTVSRILNDGLAGERTVQSSIAVARRNIAADRYLVGRPQTAQALQQTLRTRIAAETGVIPALRIIAVPDLEAVRNLTAAPTPERRTTPPPATQLPAIQESAATALAAFWPPEMGRLLGWRLLVADSAGPPRVELRYAGAAATAGTDALLSRMLSEQLGTMVEVAARAVDTQASSAPWSEGLQWLPLYLEALHELGDLPLLHACVGIPRAANRRHETAIAPIAAIVELEAIRLGNDRVQVLEGDDRWSVQLWTGPCPEPETEGATSEG